MNIVLWSTSMFLIKRLLLFLSPFLGFPFAFAHVKPPQELLEKAIGGDASSQSGLGLYYLQHGDKEQAIVWWKKAAEQNYTGACVKFYSGSRER